MKISELKEGTLLEIYIRRDGYNYKVVSRIEYVDDERVGVTPIASRTSFFKFKDSDIVDIVYRADNDSWKWSKVKAGVASLQDGTKLHVFAPRGEAEVFNRRTTYRLPMSLDIELRYEVLELKRTPGERERSRRTPDTILDATLSEISESYREYTCPALLKDLSEGGAAVYTDAELKKGDIVGFELNFNGQIVKCRGIVIRSKKVNRISDAEPYANFYGLSYIETSKNYVTYFFTEQRRMLSEKQL